MDESKYIKIFRSESEEHIREIGKSLDTLTRTGTDDAAQASIMGRLHSMKGISSTMGYAQLSELCHVAEDIIATHKDKSIALGDKPLTLLFEVIDLFDKFRRALPEEKNEPVNVLITKIEKMIQEVPDNEGTHADEPPETKTGPPDDTMIDSVDEIITSIDNNLNVDVAMIDSLIDEVSELKYSEAAVKELSGKLDSYKLKLLLKKSDTLLTHLFHSLVELKMQPFDTIIDQLKRAINGYCLSGGKKIVFTANSNNIEIDATILKQLISPLIHLIRNSIDHGIESTEERKSLNKPAHGTVTLNVTKVHDFAEIRVRDDGCGLPVSLILKKAFDDGYLNDIPNTVDNNLLLFILTRPGFTTRYEAGMVSGRGLGLDVVRTSLENIGGSIALTTEAGFGTEIIIKVPITTAVIRSLLVRAGDDIVSIPSSSVEKVLSVSADALTFSQDDATIEYTLNGKTVPVKHLQTLIIGASKAETNSGARGYSMLLVMHRNMRTGLLVDEILQEEDLFIKPLPRPLKKMDSLLGYSMLGDGSPIFVLDINSI